MSTWIIVGASRGIGLEFVRQLLARGDHVIATIRDPAKASQLWSLAGAAEGGSCQLFECDVTEDASITVSSVWSTLYMAYLTLCRNSPTM